MKRIGLEQFLADAPAFIERSEKAQTQAVTVDSFRRAESDHYFAVRADMCGGVGRFLHNRQPTDVDHQSVIRVNRDTLYSYAVFDLADPVTITFPDPGDRFMSMICINQDHYIKYVAYDPGDHELTEDLIGTRYVHIAFRTFVNPDDPVDVEAAHVLQDGILVRQPSAGDLELPDWDQESLAACRTAVLGMGPFVPDSKRMFGDVDEVDQVRHLIGTAGGWGGNREQDAVYLNVMPDNNDGQTAYVLQVQDVPVDGFWSVSLYNAAGFFEKNQYGAYSVNNVTAVPDDDGSFTIHFGGDPASKNFLYIMPGWNYTVRLYRPQEEILDGSWQFPAAMPVSSAVK